ncbi:phosphotransferase [Aeoliella mucimassa]|uniref:Homoserine kinase n=1 Tax=Aeoliella mucimassa TaxID=2527972 RepID=A0A518ATJ7_9BACT|nr:phosphotransferase [Aeoliella mucimassa]QDU58048.1 homoserine kinase [Aeoliella mucimassa]
MIPEQVIAIVQQGWPQLAVAGAAATPVTTGRFSTDPLWRIESSGGTYALKGWPTERNEQALRAHRYVNHLAVHFAIPVPVPHTCSQQNTPLYRTANQEWELTSWLTGAALDHPPDERQLIAAAEALAQLHLATRDLPAGSGARGSSPPWSRYADQLQQLKQQISASVFAGCQLPVLARSWQPAWPDASHALDRGATLALGQLQAIPATQPCVQWIWGDAWHGNLLFDGSRVTGLVDFAAVRVDTPLADLARLLGMAASPDSAEWSSALDAYAQVKPLSQGDRQTVIALHAAGTVLSLGNWLRWLSVEQRRFADPQAVLERVDQFAQRLAKLLGLSEKGRFS